MPLAPLLIIFIFSCFFAEAQTATNYKIDSAILSDVKTNKDVAYCPDSLMAKYVKIFAECSCYRNDDLKIKTSKLGLKVLNTGYDICTNKKKIIVGSCWTFVNEVYNLAGFPDTKRSVIFRGNYSGPYADSRLLQPGDWVYHVNYSYREVEHSAIFVCWKNYEKRIAIMLGYVGQNRSSVGYYGEFDMRSVYYITRPKPF
jgi:hypothetical protein